jgi:hypothetical protein
MKRVKLTAQHFYFLHAASNHTPLRFYWPQTRAAAAPLLADLIHAGLLEEVAPDTYVITIAGRKRLGVMPHG